jgi:hypothetical protein
VGTKARKTLAFAGGMALIAGLLTIVSRYTEPPTMPRGTDHRGLSSNETCAPCHGLGAPWPVSPRHPPKEDCLKCHGTPRKPAESSLPRG